MQVTRETIIGDILDMDQTTAPYFHGDRHALSGAALHPAARASRRPVLSTAWNCDELIEKLNTHLAAKKA